MNNTEKVILAFMLLLMIPMSILIIQCVDSKQEVQPIDSTDSIDIEVDVNIPSSRPQSDTLEGYKPLGLFGYDFNSSIEKQKEANINIGAK